MLYIFSTAALTSFLETDILCPWLSPILVFVPFARQSGFPPPWGELGLESSEEEQLNSTYAGAARRRAPADF
jgi:hypothetical protein